MNYRTFIIAIFGAIAFFALAAADWEDQIDGELAHQIKNYVEELTGATLPDQTGNGGEYLTTDGSTASWGAVVPTPGGSGTQVQYNDNGALGGDSGMTWNETNDLLSVGGIVFGADRMSNSVASAGFKQYTGGTSTNECAAFVLKTEGAIQLGGNATHYTLDRDSSGRWGIGSTTTGNIFTLGTSTAFAQAIKNASATLNATENRLINYCDASSGEVELTLQAPTAVPNRAVYFQKYDGTTNAVKLTSTSLINGKTNFWLRSQGEAVLLQADNSSNTWRVISHTEGPNVFQRHQRIIPGVDTRVIAGNAFAATIDTNNVWNISYYQNAAAQNDSHGTWINVAAGVYDVACVYAKHPANGQLRVRVYDIENTLTATLFDTIECYAAGASYLNGSTMVWTNAVNGAYEIKFDVPSKNASSSGYGMNVSYVTMTRRTLQ